MPDHKLTRLTLSQANLAIFVADQVRVLGPPLRARDQKTINVVGAKKAKVTSSGRKVMASVFWDAKGFAFINYHHIGRTINREYYANLLKELREAIKAKCPRKLTTGVLFQQDNAPAHKLVVAMAAVHDCGFTLLNHHPCSPDLAPLDYFLFLNMKKHLAGRHYQSDEEVTF